MFVTHYSPNLSFSATRHNKISCTHLQISILHNHHTIFTVRMTGRLVIHSVAFVVLVIDCAAAVGDIKPWGNNINFWNNSFLNQPLPLHISFECLLAMRKTRITQSAWTVCVVCVSCLRMTGRSGGGRSVVVSVTETERPSSFVIATKYPPFSPSVWICVLFRLKLYECTFLSGWQSDKQAGRQAKKGRFRRMGRPLFL